MAEALHGRSIEELESSSRRRIAGMGVVSDLIRHYDWGSNPLGAIEHWPSELVVSVNTMLASKLIACLIWGPERILLYNDLYKPLIGNKPFSLGEPFLNVWDEIRDQAKAIISEPWQTGTANLFERIPFDILINGEIVERICTLTNTPVWVETVEGLQIGGLYQTIVDETEGVLAERALRESQTSLQRSYAELQAIYDGGAVAGALIDPKTFQYMRVNRKLSEMLDQPAEGLVGTSVFDLAHNVSGLRSQLEQVAAGASLIGVTEEGELTDGKGARRYWRSNYVPVRQDGEIIGIAAASIEVTAERKAEAALIQNEKLAAVGRLASSIAHEINNPLEAVTNLLYLVRSSRDLSEIHDYIDVAERELKRVSLIANQTLRFHKQATNPEPCFCIDLISESLSLFQGRLVNSGIEVEKRKRAKQAVICFGGEIRQVLSNLIGNAIDAMQRGGRLLIRSRDVQNFKTGARGLVITVADTGSGMNASTQKQIFEPFFTTKGIGGTGLGLWVSCEIVGRHNGSLRVRSSQKEGSRGTVFVLFLPFDSPKANSQFDPQSDHFS